MQHEASIPEDILDQRHIEDEQQNAEGVGEEDIVSIMVMNFIC